MRKFNRGDTLVEVLLGVTIFSLVAVIALETMNRGMAIAQYSLETTLVRQQVDAQAEMLRYAHDMKNDTWKKLVDNNSVSVSVVNDNEGNLGVEKCPDDFSTKEFALAATPSLASKISILNNPGDYKAAETYARVDSDTKKTYGISVRLVKPSTTTGSRDSNKYDAYIKACWMPVGSKMPATIGTIVRLYDSGL
ncbi:type II secretion system protein [TM7 phylum sp. oral taxon 352]|jgi:prepilin-type cleavage/methylation N-terminal domain protein|nr:type II secretion system protein [TM7 phylum sp. oral taxon 352]TWP16913.1 type II secretion system protein [TM7 phylum sp. oral taxon 352]TWP18266.1 type II secretion system protein [TM7 phylum sp. oral taxon 352]TWP19010.1 type II secretion system protein [TM7 phylum sp. oral taxon 352]